MTRGDVVLTEASFLGQNASNNWQQHEVPAQLASAPCLFLGTSLTDLNIVRYLYEPQGSQRHAVVFVRQAEIYDVPEHVRDVREDVAISRWGSQQVDVIFVDHYSDVAQLLHEIAKRRATTPPEAYVSLPERANKYLVPIEENALYPTEKQSFRRRQERLNETLVAILDHVCAAMAVEGVDLADEEGLAFGLWLIDKSGGELTAWTTTDRIHCELSGVQTVGLDPDSRWVAVVAYCAGRYIQEERDYSDSRWSYIVGIPLWTKGDSEFGRLPIGALTVTTQTPVADTKLADMTTEQQATFAKLMAETALIRLEQLRLP